MIAAGLPSSVGAALTTVAVNRSSVVLPMLERGIEEVLHTDIAANPFRDNKVDRDRFVAAAVSLITYAGNGQSMVEIDKLLKLDESRFGTLVETALIEAENRANPIPLIYTGLALRNPLMDKRIDEWLVSQFGAKTQYRVRQMKDWWAAALVHRYGGMPTEREWTEDPVRQRLGPRLADELRNDVMTRAAEAAERRRK